MLRGLYGSMAISRLNPPLGFGFLNKQLRMSLLLLRHLGNEFNSGLFCYKKCGKGEVKTVWAALLDECGENGNTIITHPPYMIQR